MDAQENSLQSQREYFVSYIQANPRWEYAGLYVDDGKSGLSYRKREGFRRMVQDALDGKIDRIITKSLSWFARNTVDSLITIRKLKAAGVAVYFRKEKIDTMDARGEFLLTLMSSFAEEKSRSISENVKWAVRRRYARGIYSVVRKNFLGFTLRNGAVEIDPQTAEVVRYIYWLSFQGYSPYSIAKHLSDNNILSPGKKRNWRLSTVQSILKNERYIGDARLQKTVTIDFLTKVQKKNEGGSTTVLRRKWASSDH